MICIKSLLEIYNTLVVNQDILQYIPCYKFSQDHIKLFFGCIRAQGGCNNNPTARQFKAAYKKLLVHTEIADKKTGNCIPLDAIAILHVSSNSENIINQSTPTSRLFEDSSCEDNNNLDLPFLSGTVELSQCSIRIIAYIAGFVVRNLKKVIRCNICVMALCGSETHQECSLINIKNRGKLVIPSHNVIVICKIAEFVIRFALRESGGKRLLKKMTETFLLHKVMHNFIENDNVFRNLEEHSCDQTPLQNHRVHLIRAVASKYIKIRLYFIGRTITDNENSLRIRQQFTKIVLFKGQ